MDKAKLVWITPNAEELITYIARVSNPQNQQKQLEGELENPLGLLRYCVRQKHWSVFEMANICVGVNTERDIAAQILRHWSLHVQEFSQRYQDVSQLGSIEYPEIRLQDFKNKQNSLPWEAKGVLGKLKKFLVLVLVKMSIDFSWWVYQIGLKCGCSKETMRRVLPLCTPTRMYLNGTVRDMIHWLQVRLKPDTQKEHREVVQAVKEIFCREMPTIGEAVFGE